MAGELPFFHNLPTLFSYGKAGEIDEMNERTAYSSCSLFGLSIETGGR